MRFSGRKLRVAIVSGAETHANPCCSVGNSCFPGSVSFNLISNQKIASGVLTNSRRCGIIIPTAPLGVCVKSRLHRPKFRPALFFLPVSLIIAPFGGFVNPFVQIHETLCEMLLFCFDFCANCP